MTETIPHHNVENKQSCNQKIQLEKQQQNNIPVTNPKLLQAVTFTIESLISQDGNSKEVQNSVFYKEKIPQISLLKYIERIKKFSQMENCIFVVAMIYLERFLKAQKIINLTPNTVHKLIFTASVLSIKFNCDTCFTNEYYAKVGGIPKKELNDLEVQFLEIIDYNCNVKECYYGEREQELEKLTEKL